MQPSHYCVGVVSSVRLLLDMSICLQVACKKLVENSDPVRGLAEAAGSLSVAIFATICYNDQRVN